MTDIRAIFATWLAADNTVGPMCNHIVSPVRTRQNSAYPNISYRVIDEQYPRHLTGRCGFTGILLRVDCADNQSEANATALALAVRNLIESFFRGTIGGVNIQGMLVRNATDDPTDPQQADDLGIFTVSMNVQIWYEG